MYYIGNRGRNYYTFIPFEVGYAHCDLITSCVKQYGGRFDSFLGEIATYIDVNEFCYRRVVVEHPEWNVSYDGSFKLMVKVGRAQRKFDFSSYTDSVKVTPLGYELRIRSQDDYVQMKIEHSEHGTFIYGSDVVRARPKKKWVPNLLGVYASVLGNNRIIAIRDDDFFFYDDDGLRIYTPGGVVQCTVESYDVSSDNFPTLPRSPSGRSTIATVSSCSGYGPISVRSAFRSLVGSNMRCYRHAEFNDINRLMPALVEMDFG
jgi:hypothetical protein